jgi:hypothetical protein
MLWCCIINYQLTEIYQGRIITQPNLQVSGDLIPDITLRILLYSGPSLLQNNYKIRNFENFRSLWVIPKLKWNSNYGLNVPQFIVYKHPSILQYVNNGDETQRNVHPRTGHEGPDGKQRYSSALSLIWVLDGSEWSTPRSGQFNSGKETWCPWDRRLVGPVGRSGTVGKISPHRESIPGPWSP